MDEIMCYCARMPEDKDFFAIASDWPEYKEDLAKDIAGWIKRGAIVEHVTLKEGHASFSRYCQSR